MGPLDSEEREAMVAFVDIGGKQYRAEVGREIVVDRVAAEPDSVVELRPVLVVGDDGSAQLSADGDLPVVTARVVEHFRGPKISIWYHKPKRGFLRRKGFRSELTRLAVDSIG
jgi:large subunit ribosomal protein L21